MRKRTLVAVLAIMALPVGAATGDDLMRRVEQAQLTSAVGTLHESPGGSTRRSTPRVAMWSGSGSCSRKRAATSRP